MGLDFAKVKKEKPEVTIAVSFNLSKCLLATLVSVLVTTSLRAQSLLTLGGSGERPSFINKLSEAIPGGESWRYSFEVSQQYDSNPSLSENGGDERYFLDFSPTISYLTDPEGGAPNRLGVTYRPRLRLDWSDSDRSEVLHDTNAYFRSVGARGDLLIFGSLVEVSDAERLVGDFVEGRTQSVGANLSYQVATRSRLLFRTQLAQAVFDSATVDDLTTFDIGFGFDWQNENEWRLGPFLRYVNTESDTVGTREALVLLLAAEKETAKGFSFQALGGLDFSTFEQSGESALNLTGSLLARGTFGGKWSWEADIGIVTSPSVAAENAFFTDYRGGVVASRRLAVGDLSIGGEFSFTSFETLGSLGASGDNSVSRLFTSYRRPVFVDAGYLDLGVGYAISRGQQDWERLTVNLSLGTQF